MAAPWLRLTKTKRPVSAEQTILADYLDMWAHQVFFTACRHRDWLVILSTATTVALLAATVLSTSLLNLAPVRVAQPVPVTLQSTFRNDASSMEDAGTGAFLTLMGLVNNTLPFPDGTSSRFVHQRFTYDNTKGGPVTEMRAVVDGMAVDVRCEGARLDGWENHLSDMDFRISTPDCRLESKMDKDSPISAHRDMIARYWGGYCNDGTRQPEDFRIGVIVMELDQYYPVRQPPAISGSLHRSTQLICSPTYSLVKLDTVSQAGSIQRLAVAEGSPASMLGHVGLGDMMAFMHGRSMPARVADWARYPDICGGFASLPEYCAKGQSIDLDQRLVLALLLYGPSPTPPLSSLFDAPILGNFTAYFLQQYIIQAVNEGLTEPTSETITGTSRALVDRLLVRSLSTHWMVACLAAAMVLAAIIATLAPRGGVLPRPPNTIVGIALNLAVRGGMLQMLSNPAVRVKIQHKRHVGLPNSSLSNIKQLWTWPRRLTRILGREEAGFSEIESASYPTSPVETTTWPLAIRPLTRSVVILTILGLIIALERLLRKSQQSNGLAEILDRDTVFNYLWSFGPAIISLLLAAYHTCVDFTVRSRQPLTNMCGQQGAPHASTVGMDLVDSSLPAIVVNEIRTGSPALLCITTASLLAAFLTVFSASLFSTRSTQLSSNNWLQLQDAFAPRLPSGYNTSEWGFIAGPLILTKNMSYPAFTYEDLVLPYLKLEAPFSGNRTGDTSESLSTSFNVKATIPALRPRLNCRFYEPSIIHSYIDHPKYEPINIVVQLAGRFRPQNRSACEVISTDFEKGTGLEYTVGLGAITSVFENSQAIRGTSVLNYGNRCGADFIFVWGTISAVSPEQNSIIAYGCNETIEVVEAAVHLVGPDLRIDPSNPPVVPANSIHPAIATPLRPNSTIAHNSTRWEIEDIYMNSIRDIIPAGPATVDQFFRILTASPLLSIPVSALADTANATWTDRITAAIHRQHGIIRAQGLSAEYRRPINSTNPLEDSASNINLLAAISSGSADSVTRVNATVTDPQGRTRLIQDAGSTRVLEGLLGGILLCSVAGWVLLSRGLAGRLWNRDGGGHIPDLDAATGYGQREPQDGGVEKSDVDLAVWGGSPTCIADVAALLVGSNIWAVLESAAASCPSGDGTGGLEYGEAVLKGCKFKLGWVDIEGDGAAERDSLEMDRETVDVQHGADYEGSFSGTESTKTGEKAEPAGGSRVLALIVIE
jgi:hypothetical protein